MDAAFCFAVIALAIVALGALAAVVIILLRWPTDHTAFRECLEAYRGGRDQGKEMGRRLAGLEMREAKLRSRGAQPGQDDMPQKDPGEVTISQQELLQPER